MIKFAGKNILITGASSGIGKELAEQFSETTCTLHLISRRINLLADLQLKLKNGKRQIFIYECNVSSKRDVAETYKQIISAAGKIDIAILNAGVSCRSRITKFDSGQIQNLFDTNVMGIVHWVEQLVPEMINNNAGVIVGISSLADSRGYAKSGAYCASKAAVTRFLESLRLELAVFGVKVLTVKPGFVKTAMTDKNKFKMPFLMDVNRAVKIIINGIKREKKIIQFPLPTVIGSKLIGILPIGLYDLISKYSKVK